MFSNKKIEEMRERVNSALQSQAQTNADLFLEIEKLKTHINSLRGLINRKLAAAPDQKLTEEENLKSPDGLDELR